MLNVLTKIKKLGDLTERKEIFHVEVPTEFGVYDGIKEKKCNFTL